MTAPKPWENYVAPPKPPKPEVPLNSGTPVPPPWGDAPADTMPSKSHHHRGPRRKLATPDDVREAGQRYLEWCRDNPIEVPKTHVVKGEVQEYVEKRKRPITKMGFARFIGITWRGLVHMSDVERRGQEYVDALDEVFASFDAEVLEGGLSNIYNGMLVARVLSLAENVNSTIEDNRQPAPPDPYKAVNKVHPDDPDPLREDPLLFSQQQIDAGVQFPMKTVGGED